MRLFAAITLIFSAIMNPRREWSGVATISVIKFSYVRK